ncbi:uncharacterized protein [Triticum aestivum]|uniref:uncharacterized protein isoform X9 n=1 Tax=Triticum aestivum TaxID=4565 RepID=UPI001D002993|nr:uncharacterized protein LOC123111182 isoform X9 [Triticum aestivum]
MRRSREALSRSVLLTIGSGPCHSRSSLDGRLFLFSVSGFLLCLSFRLAFTGLALVAQSILPTEVPPTCTKLLRQGGRRKEEGGAVVVGSPVRWHWIGTSTELLLTETKIRSWGCEDPGRHSPVQFSLLSVQGHATAGWLSRDWHWWRSQYYLQKCHQLAPSYCVKFYLISINKVGCTLTRGGGERKREVRWWLVHRSGGTGLAPAQSSCLRKRRSVLGDAKIQGGTLPFSSPCYRFRAMPQQAGFHGIGIGGAVNTTYRSATNLHQAIASRGEEKGRGRCGGGWFTGPVALDWHQHRAPAYGNEDPFLGMRRSREALSRSVLLTIGSGPCHSRSSLDGRLFLFSVSGFLLCLSFRLAFTGLALVAQSILPTEVPPTCTKLLRQGGEEKGRGRCGGGWFTGPVALDWHQHRAPAYGNDDPFLGMRRSREALSRSVLLAIGSGPCHSRSSLDGRLFLFSVSGFLLCLSFRLAFTGLALVAQSILPTEVPPTCTKLLRQGGMYINKGGGERKREVRWWLVHRSGGTGLAPAQSSCLRKRRSVLGDAKILGGTLPFSSPYYRFRAMPPQVKVNPLLGWQT